MITSYYINANVDASLENLNNAYHCNMSELKDFTVKQTGADSFKLISLYYNGYNQPMETELTPCPVTESELISTMDSLAEKYWEIG